MKGKHIDTGASPVLDPNLPGMFSSIGDWAGSWKGVTTPGEQVTGAGIVASAGFAGMNEYLKWKQAQLLKSRTFAHEDALAKQEWREAKALEREEEWRDLRETSPLYAPYRAVVEGYKKLRGIGVATKGDNFRGHF